MLVLCAALFGVNFRVTGMEMVVFALLRVFGSVHAVERLWNNQTLITEKSHIVESLYNLFGECD